MTARRPIRVLHLCPDFWPNMGGVEQFVLELATFSKRAGLEPSVLCFNRVAQREGTLPDRDQVNGIPIHRVPFLNLRMYTPAILPQKLMREADVLHVHGARAMLDYAVLTKPLHGRPIVLSTHGGVFHSGGLELTKRIYFHYFSRWMQQRVEQTIACSKSDFELFQPVSPRLMLIENGVDISRFDGSPRALNQPARFLHLGRLSRLKRIENLIEAFSLARGPFALRIAGPDDHHLTRPLRAFASARKLGDRISFVGAIPAEQLAAEYRAADYFVSASPYEGFGISVIEAMASGCVPVLNRIAAFENLVTDGKDGYLTDFNDAKASATLIDRIIAQPRADMPRAARQTAERYSWDAKIEQFIAVYERLARLENVRHG